LPLVVGAKIRTLLSRRCPLADIPRWPEKVASGLR
jgi:hypothetical protein